MASSWLTARIIVTVCPHVTWWLSVRSIIVTVRAYHRDCLFARIIVNVRTYHHDCLRVLSWPSVRAYHRDRLSARIVTVCPHASWWLSVLAYHRGCLSARIIVTVCPQYHRDYLSARIIVAVCPHVSSWLSVRTYHRRCLSARIIVTVRTYNRRCLSARIIVPPPQRIFVICYIGDLQKICRQIPELVKAGQQCRVLAWRPKYFYIVACSTKYFVAERQCKGNPFWRFCDNTQRFCIVDNYAWGNKNTKKKHCFRLYRNNGYSNATQYYMLRTLPIWFTFDQCTFSACWNTIFTFCGSSHLLFFAVKLNVTLYQTMKS